jgi:hypothetical protein
MSNFDDIAYAKAVDGDDPHWGIAYAIYKLARAVEDLQDSETNTALAEHTDMIGRAADRIGEAIEKLEKLREYHV